MEKWQAVGDLPSAQLQSFRALFGLSSARVFPSSPSLLSPVKSTESGDLKSPLSPIASSAAATAASPPPVSYSAASSTLDADRWSAALDSGCTLTVKSEALSGTPPLDKAAILRLVFEYGTDRNAQLTVAADEKSILSDEKSNTVTANVSFGGVTDAARAFFPFEARKKSDDPNSLSGLLKSMGLDRELLSQQIEVSTRRRVLLLGGPKTGKTTFGLHVRLPDLTTGDRLSVFDNLRLSLAETLHRRFELARNSGHELKAAEAELCSALAVPFGKSAELQKRITVVNGPNETASVSGSAPPPLAAVPAPTEYQLTDIRLSAETVYGVLALPAPTIWIGDQTRQSNDAATLSESDRYRLTHFERLHRLAGSIGDAKSRTPQSASAAANELTATDILHCWPRTGTANAASGGIEHAWNVSAVAAASAAVDTKLDSKTPTAAAATAAAGAAVRLTLVEASEPPAPAPKKLPPGCVVSNKSKALPARQTNKLWLNQFDDAKGLIFVVNLSDYAATNPNTGGNLLGESLSYFQRLMSERMFQSTPTALVFSGADLFGLQVAKNKPLSAAFPEFDDAAAAGSSADPVRAAIEYIRGRFEAAAGSSKSRTVYLSPALNLSTLNGIAEATTAIAKLMTASASGSGADPQTARRVNQLRSSLADIDRVQQHLVAPASGGGIPIKIGPEQFVFRFDPKSGLVRSISVPAPSPLFEKLLSAYLMLGDVPIPTPLPGLVIQLFGGSFTAATAAIRKQIWYAMTSPDLTVIGPSLFGRRTANRDTFISALFDVCVPALPNYNFNLQPAEIKELGGGKVQFTLRASGTHSGAPFTLPPFQPIVASGRSVQLPPETLIATFDVRRSGGGDNLLLRLDTVRGDRAYSGLLGVYFQLGGMLEQPTVIEQLKLENERLRADARESQRTIIELQQLLAAANKRAAGAAAAGGRDPEPA